MRVLQVLFYDYVPDVVERRAPFREAHLAHIAAWKERGALRLAGATGDPPSAALFVFAAGTDLGDLETFASDDPYVHAGLVTGRRVEPWTVV